MTAIVSGEKRAPVQGFSGGIPWSLHLRAYDAYSKKWSPQPAMIDLEGRNCRGGFSADELDDFVPGWREEVAENTTLKADLTAARSDIADLRAKLAEAGLALEAILPIAKGSVAYAMSGVNRECVERAEAIIRALAPSTTGGEHGR